MDAPKGINRSKLILYDEIIFNRISQKTDSQRSPNSYPRRQPKSVSDTSVAITVATLT